MDVRSLHGLAHHAEEMPRPLLPQYGIRQVLQMHPLLGLRIPATTGGNAVQMWIVPPIVTMSLDHHDIAARESAATDTAMTGHLRAHVAALAAEQVAVTPHLRAGAPQIVLAQVASELDAALVLVGTPQAWQGFASALDGSSEALQAALPCPVYRVIPPAAGDPRGWELVRGGFFDGETTKQRPAQVFTSHHTSSKHV